MGVGRGRGLQLQSDKHAYLTDTVQAKVALEPEEGEVSIASLEEVGRHQHPHVHVDGNELATRENNPRSHLAKENEKRQAVLVNVLWPSEILKPKIL